MIADLWHAPSAATHSAIGTATTGSSEAIMLGGMAMKRLWQQKMKAKSTIRVVPDADHGMTVKQPPDSGTKSQGTELSRRASGEEAASWVLGKLDIENVSFLQLGGLPMVETATTTEDPKSQKRSKRRKKNN